jgi:pimeloyl-ACP methyl ester carboxylesterase
VFLHEGLGSVALWKDFPARLCATLQCRGLVYSRPGYGRSTPRASQEVWGLDFMHQQATEVLPGLLDALGLNAELDPPWLLGHSDGGSIALLFAAHRPASVAGVVALAPHTFVEPCTLVSIQAACAAYAGGTLRSQLARYHDQPDSAFGGWSSAWLNPAFKDWSIAQEIRAIRCPVLAVQGLDDEYGSLAQLSAIKDAVPHARVVELANCGHSPHRDQPDALMVAVREMFHPIHTARS